MSTNLKNQARRGCRIGWCSVSEMNQSLKGIQFKTSWTCFHRNRSQQHSPVLNIKSYVGFIINRKQKSASDEFSRVWLRQRGSTGPTSCVWFRRNAQLRSSSTQTLWFILTWTTTQRPGRWRPRRPPGPVKCRECWWARTKQETSPQQRPREVTWQTAEEGASAMRVFTVKGWDVEEEDALEAWRLQRFHEARRSVTTAPRGLPPTASLHR